MKLKILFLTLFYHSLAFASATAETSAKDCKAKAEVHKTIASATAAGASSGSSNPTAAQLLAEDTGNALAGSEDFEKD